MQDFVHQPYEPQKGTTLGPLGTQGYIDAAGQVQGLGARSTTTLSS